MLEILGINIKTLLIGIIIYGATVIIFNSMLAIKSVREKMNKKTLGVADMISSIIILQIWNYYLRDSVYISHALIWSIAIVCVVIMILGFINFVIGITSCNSR